MPDCHVHGPDRSHRAQRSRGARQFGLRLHPRGCNSLSMPSGCVIVLFYKYVAVPDVAETRGLLHDKCTEFGD